MRREVSDSRLDVRQGELVVLDIDDDCRLDTCVTAAQA